MSDQAKFRMQERACLEFNWLLYDWKTCSEESEMI